MSIIDRLMIGQVIKDFGHVQERQWLIGKKTQSVLLVRKKEKYQLVLKSLIVSWVGFSVTYHELDLDEAYQLRDYINQIEVLIKDQTRIDNAVTQ